MLQMAWFASLPDSVSPSATNKRTRSYTIGTTENRPRRYEEVEQVHSSIPGCSKTIYRMEESDFDVLLEKPMRHDDWKTEEERKVMCLRSDVNPVPDRTRLMLFLRHLSGSHHMDLLSTWSISKEQISKDIDVVAKIVDEIFTAKLPKFEDTPEFASQCELRRIGFRNLCRQGNEIFDGAILAGDEIVFPIVLPSTLEHDNPVSYYSDKIKGYGINVQAICDSNKIRYPRIILFILRNFS